MQLGLVEVVEPKEQQLTCLECNPLASTVHVLSQIVTYLEFKVKLYVMILVLSWMC